MGMLRLVAGQAGIALFTAAALFFQPSQARGDCSPSDLWNALENTFSTITSSGCAGVSADPALWAPVGVAAGVMAGVSQSQQFCQGVQNVQNQLSNLSGDGNSLVTQLDNLGVNADFLASALSALGSASDALSVVECSCALSNNISQLGGDAGDCIEGALCDLQNLANSLDPSAFPSCSGHVVIQQSNCTQNPCQSNGSCNPNLGNVIVQCPAGDDAPPVNQVNGPNGSGTIVSVTNGADASGNIYVQQCICPPPMQGTWTSFGNYAGWGQIVQDPNCSFFTCNCPPDSQAAATSGAGAYVCICNNTHQPAQPPIKTTTNPGGIPCPVPLTGLPCPNGQTNDAGKCVPTCASNQILLANGTCCDPAQASSCGTCCPGGQSPDPVTGACSSTPKLPRPGPPQKLR
jgi:hypothetical protein